MKVNIGLVLIFIGMLAFIVMTVSCSSDKTPEVKVVEISNVQTDIVVKASNGAICTKVCIEGHVYYYCNADLGFSPKFDDRGLPVKCIIQ